MRFQDGIFVSFRLSSSSSSSSSSSCMCLAQPAAKSFFILGTSLEWGSSKFSYQTPQFVHVMKTSSWSFSAIEGDLQLTDLSQAPVGILNTWFVKHWSSLLGLSPTLGRASSVGRLYTIGYMTHIGKEQLSPSHSWKASSFASQVLS